MHEQSAVADSDAMIAMCEYKHVQSAAYICQLSLLGYQHDLYTTVTHCDHIQHIVPLFSALSLSLLHS